MKSMTAFQLCLMALLAMDTAYSQQFSTIAFREENHDVYKALVANLPPGRVFETLSSQSSVTGALALYDELSTIQDLEAVLKRKPKQFRLFSFTPLDMAMINPGFIGDLDVVGQLLIYRPEDEELEFFLFPAIAALTDGGWFEEAIRLVDAVRTDAGDEVDPNNGRSKTPNATQHQTMDVSLLIGTIAKKIVMLEESQLEEILDRADASDQLRAGLRAEIRSFRNENEGRQEPRDTIGVEGYWNNFIRVGKDVHRLNQFDAQELENAPDFESILAFELKVLRTFRKTGFDESASLMKDLASRVERFCNQSSEADNVKKLEDIYFYLLFLHNDADEINRNLIAKELHQKQSATLVAAATGVGLYDEVTKYLNSFRDNVDWKLLHAMAFSFCDRNDLQVDPVLLGAKLLNVECRVLFWSEVLCYRAFIYGERHRSYVLLNKNGQPSREGPE